MKKYTSVSSPLVPIETAIGTGAVSLAAAAMCPALLPFALLSGFLFRGLAQKAIVEDVDEVASDDADEIAETWKRARFPGERGISVSSTLYSGGALFNFPMTRTYRYEMDEED